MFIAFEAEFSQSDRTGAASFISERARMKFEHLPGETPIVPVGFFEPQSPQTAVALTTLSAPCAQPMVDALFHLL